MYNIAVIGAGASGLAAAISAKRTNADTSVVLIEALPRVGKKILATGNGRCNLTNLNASAKDYNSFVTDVFAEYPPKKVIEFFESAGLLTVSDSEGRVYPMSNTASSVLDCLRFEAERLGVDFMCDTHVDSLEKKGSIFIVNGTVKAEKVILSSGGKAAPGQGSDGSGYRLLKSLGHTVTELYPGLVQITVSENVKALKGVRVKANVKLLNGKNVIDSSKGEVLFTDFGLSGIAVMDISRSVKNGKFTCLLDILPNISEKEIIKFLCDRKEKNPSLTADNALCGMLPKKAGQYILKGCGIHSDAPVKTLNKASVEAIAFRIKNLPFTVTGTNGFSSAQITVGGAKLSEFDSRTLESRRVKNLYCTGEILDIDAVCGGYNLQWAWASGLTAGKNAARR